AATGPGTGVVMGEGGYGEVKLNGTVGTGDKSVTVKVRDGGNRPLAGAKVAVQMQENYAVTDAAGEVLVTNLVYGVNYNFYVSADGYHPKTEPYTYWRDDRETDELVVVMEAVPETPDEAKATPAPEAGGARPGKGRGDEADDERLVVNAPAGSTRVQVPQEVVEESAATGKEIVVKYTGQDGKRYEAVLPAFSEHDAGLLDGAEVWVEELKGPMYLHLIRETTGERAELLAPHNLAQAAQKNEIGLRLTFREGESYVHSTELPEALVNAAAAGQHFDQGTRYEAGDASLLFTKGGAHSEAALPVPGEAFGFAGQQGMGLAVELCDPEQDDELWYQWLFEAEKLKKTALSGAGQAQQSYDLFITDTPQADDPILERTAGWHSQYVIIAHHGPLPVPAQLRVKNLAGFAQPVSFLYHNPETGELEPVAEGLEPHAVTGHYAAGELEHCSSYVLTTGRPEAVDGLIQNWPWWLLAVAALAGCGAGIAWSSKNKHENQEGKGLWQRANNNKRRLQGKRRAGGWWRR
uniref:carboxypeptidase-like regulatory domain-containing protein n=1 Tax=Allofournierella sp. TaxID=1940256 RepID=UPI003AF1A471